MEKTKKKIKLNKNKKSESQNANSKWIGSNFAMVSSLYIVAMAGIFGILLNASLSQANSGSSLASAGVSEEKMEVPLDYDDPSTFPSLAGDHLYVTVQTMASNSTLMKRKLHIWCSGKKIENEPTVLMDAGQGESSINWYKVQSELSKSKRVCSFDRAGLGWSEWMDGYTSDAIGQYFYQFLKPRRLASGRGGPPLVPGPYIFVGHSYGWFNVQMLAQTLKDAGRGSEIKGLVSVDGPHEKFFDEYIHLGEEQRWKGFESIGKPGTLTLAFRAGSQILDLAGLPNDIKEILLRWADDASKQVVFNEEGKSLTSSSHLLQKLAAESAAKGIPNELGDVPLMVLTRDKIIDVEGQSLRPEGEALWQSTQALMVAKSSRGVQRIVKGAGHSIHWVQPAAVVEAIHDVSETAAAIQVAAAGDVGAK